MLAENRPGFARLTALAAVGVSCLAAAACGSGGSSGTAANTGAAASPSASSTVDPLAAMTGKQVADKAVADAKAASSLTMAGTVHNSGQTFTVNLGFKPGQGCAGTLGEGSKGSFKLIVIGSTAYLNPDARFWKTYAGPQASAVIELVNGRYIKASTGNANMASLAKMCDMSQMLASLKVAGTVTKGPVSTLNGTRVLQLKDSTGGVMYVTDTSTPQIVQIVKTKDTGDGSGKVTMSVGAPVTLTAPPASQVIDGSKLGF